MAIEHYEDKGIRFRLSNFVKAANRAIACKVMSRLVKYLV